MEPTERQIELAYMDGKAKALDDINFGTDTSCPHKDSILAKWWHYGYADELNVETIRRYFVSLRVKVGIRTPINWATMRKIGWKEMRELERLSYPRRRGREGKP